jgi:uroporphyrinogen III methyltransferase/synthase
LDWILCSSSNMARTVVGWLDGELAEAVRKSVGLVSISPVTSQAIREAGFEPAAEAAVYTLDGLVAALVSAYWQKRRGQKPAESSVAPSNAD